MNARILAFALGLACAVGAQAALVTNAPSDAVAAGVAESPAFSPLASGGTVGASLINFGVDYSYGNAEGFFNDPPLAFCGINGSGNCDLLSAVDGRIVLLGTQTQGLTRYVQVEAGFFDDPANGLLSVFDAAGNLLASTSGVGFGPNGRDLFTISRAIDDIAFFSLSGRDTFGVNRVTIETPGGTAPEPATLAVFGIGLVGLAVLRRRKV